METDLKYVEGLIEKMYNEGLLTVDFNQASCPIQDTFDKWMRDYGNDFIEQLSASQNSSTSDEALPIGAVVGRSEQLPQPDCHFYDEEHEKWVWAYSTDLIDSLR